MSKEITKATIDLAPLGEEAMELADVLAVFNEEMEGLGAIPMPRVQTPSGGGLAFTIGEGDDADVAKELRGVIVMHQSNNVYYDKSIEESDGDNMPRCSSFDGKAGIDNQTGEIRECATCPFNQFGPDGGKKPCHNRHNVYLLREGDMLPTLISLPATSVQNFKKLIVNSVVLKKRRCCDVVVKVTLEKAESRGGQAFSRYKFALDKELTPDEKEKMRRYAESFKAYIDDRNAEYMQRSLAQASDVIEIKDVSEASDGDVNIPF